MKRFKIAEAAPATDKVALRFVGTSPMTFTATGPVAPQAIRKVRAAVADRLLITGLWEGCEEEPAPAPETAMDTPAPQE